ncbi:sensor histidine kinase [Pseudonocardia sp. TRM90224]|uniref:sensor histidine kinase n=1 Tax=Pseudonocardia sp. TRM90224 TaxID=2812678 RepID=UPI001E54BBBC|nr:ATP-binding protein [Pseudonocardia sp. TRM90224]
MRRESNKNASAHPHDKVVRKRLTLVVLIPSVTLLVLWGVASSFFVLNGVYVRAVAASVRQVSIPAVTALAAFQEERRHVLQYLDNPALDQRELTARWTLTDQRLATLETAFDSTIAYAPNEIAVKMTALKGQFDYLTVLRFQISTRGIDRAQVSSYYDGVLDTASNLFDTQARVVPDAQAAMGGLTAVAVFRSAELMSRESSLVSSALAAGVFVPESFVRYTQLLGFYRTQLAQVAPFLEPEVRADYEALTTSATWQQLAGAEDALVRHGAWVDPEREPAPVAAADWQRLTADVADRLNGLAIKQADKVSAAALASGDRQLLNAVIGSIVALLASVIAILLAVRVSRSLVDRTSVMARLARLRDDALDLARNRLPSIVQRLKSGEPVDLDDELPRLDHGEDEIGQVADAFNAAQEAAVNAAVSEAKARSGLNNVFLGIAHRNQVLVHEQLRLIDELESREGDSTQLASLFRLDHLSARARRTTENLIILGGGQPGRRWRKPVALMEVLRAAVSETEEYARVRVEQIPDVAIVGAVVADVVHMVAELVDNATSFSPPGAPVEVTGRAVARGVAVEVSDQGLGMKDDVRQEANQMMAAPPEFDAMALRADATLGLFVIARLSARLGTTVTFDPSRLGGLRVTVLIPSQHLSAAQPVEPADEVDNGSTALTPPAAWAALDTRSATSTARLPEQVADRPRPRPRPAPAPTPAMARAESVPAVAPRATRADGPAAPALVPSDDRPRLPQRKPQQHLAAELREEPEDGLAEAPAGERTAHSLAAFHKGTRLGREERRDV